MTFYDVSKACTIAQGMRPHRLVSESSQKAEIHPSSSMRWRAGKSEPGLTTKVPPVICWTLREIPNPCNSHATSDFKISRSGVPSKGVGGSDFKTTAPMGSLYEPYSFYL